MHRLLVTAPITAMAFGFGFLLFGLAKRRVAARRLGLAFLIGASLIGLLAFAAGRRAERGGRALPGVAVERIDQHARGAEAARIALLVLAAASIGALLARDDSAAHPWLGGGILVFALVAMLLVARATLLGGAIRHADPAGVSSGAAPPAPAGPGG